jgi:dolichol-phosphate mannosyltransferase
MKLSVLIPAHDEEGSLEATLRPLHASLLEAGIDHELLVVNDNSTDQTEAILIDLMKEIPTLIYINNPPPNGFGFAVRAGLNSFNGDAVAIVMADASDRPEDVVRCFEAMEEQGVDCVFGSRWMQSSQVVDYPLFKRIVNRAVNIGIRILFGFRYNDTTNAFKMYRRHVIEGLGPLLSHHFNLTVELPLKSIVRGYSYAVIPIGWIGRQEGASKLVLREMGSRYLFIVLYCFIERWLSAGDYHRGEHQRRLSDRVAGCKPAEDSREESVDSTALERRL